MFTLVYLEQDIIDEGSFIKYRVDEKANVVCEY